MFHVTRSIALLAFLSAAACEPSPTATSEDAERAPAPITTERGVRQARSAEATARNAVAPSSPFLVAAGSPAITSSPGAAQPATTPPPRTAPPPGISPPAATTPPAATIPPPGSRLTVSPALCGGSPPGPGFVCMRGCGPAVSTGNDPDPGFVWLSPKQAESRRLHGCPICLPRTARIATPSGEVRADQLRAGDKVFTADRAGARIVSVVRAVASTPAPLHHRLVRLLLSDGRAVAASPGHPTAEGIPLAKVSVGDTVDRARVVAIESIDYDGDATFDLLPEGPTGLYWADGVLLGSTLRR